jgi:hypothetical protein
MHVVGRRRTSLSACKEPHLIAISIKEVEDVGEVVLCLALGEEEEEDHHVGHGCNMHK